MKALFSTFQTL